MLWNRNRRSDAEAERRGAVAAKLYVGAPLRLKIDNGRWFQAQVEAPVRFYATDGKCSYELRLDEEGDQWKAIKRGEILPAKKGKTR